MLKEDVKKKLKNMETQDNKAIIERRIKSLDRITDEEFSLMLKELNVTEENVEQVLSSRIEEQLQNDNQHDDFIPVNQMFSYGRTGDTLHMHLIPKDLRGLKSELGDEAFYDYMHEQLEDFLSRLQEVFLEDDSIKQLFAVSPIFYNKGISAIHEDLGFDKLTEIDLDNENDGMSEDQKIRFINMFNKDGGHNRKVYYTKMTRGKLLGSTYSQITEEKPLIK